MKKRAISDNAELLRLLPSIDALLRSETAIEILRQVGAKQLTLLARVATDSLRREIQEKTDRNDINTGNYSREILLEEAEKRLKNALQSEQKTSLQRVINATGVIIHTNLGSAPL